MSDPTDADLIEEIASALPLLPDDPGLAISIMRILLRRPAAAWRDPDMHQDFADQLSILERHGTAAQQADRARYAPPVPDPSA